MLTRIAAAAALAWPGAAAGQGAVGLPAEVRGEPGQFVRVTADTDAKHVRWVVLDGGLNLFPPELLRDSRTAVMTAGKPGRYRLLAYTAFLKGGDAVPTGPAVCTVVVGKADPTPQPDALTARLREAYRADAGTAADKRAAAGKLARLYRQAALTVTDARRVTTALSLMKLLKDAADSLGLGTALPRTRRAIAAELRDVLPTDADAVLSSSSRRRAAALFNRIAAALGGER